MYQWAEIFKCSLSFIIQLGSINEWFDKTEVTLELVTSEPLKPDDQLTQDEQIVLIQVRSTILYNCKLFQCQINADNLLRVPDYF